MARKGAIGARVEGTSATVAALKGIKAGVANRVLRESLRALATITNKRAKNALRVRRSGLTGKSIGIVMRKGKAGPVAVVGPRKGFARPGPDGRPHDPVKTAHLVEGGRKEVRPKTKKVMANKAVPEAIYGKQADAVAAKPFMKPAADYTRTVGPKRMAKLVKDGIAREAAKYKAKGKSITGAAK